MQKDNEKIIDKIKKCLALSRSANEHEAEAALRQARKLMEAHGVTDLDIEAAEAQERRRKAGAKTKPSNWEAALANRISGAFGCRLLFSGGWMKPGEWVFIGCGSAPEIAQYAFDVLLRQVKRAREEHIKAKLKRCKTATKTRRADLFCDGWVIAVAGHIDVFAGNEQQTKALDAYMAKHYPSTGDLATTDRNDGRRLRDHEYDDYTRGRLSGKDAQLHHGVSSGGIRPALK